LAIGTAAGLDATVVALAVAAATGFCILTPVGSKALMIFAGSKPDGLAPRTLLRTGGILLPFYFALTFAFAWLVWPQLLGGA
jgi:di/tricarboxylate transporter